MVITIVGVMAATLLFLSGSLAQEECGAAQWLLYRGPFEAETTVFSFRDLNATTAFVRDRFFGQNGHKRVFNVVQPGEDEMIPSLEFRGIQGYEWTQVRFIPLSEDETETPAFAFHTNFVRRIPSFPSDLFEEVSLVIPILSSEKSEDVPHIALDRHLRGWAAMISATANYKCDVQWLSRSLRDDWVRMDSNLSLVHPSIRRLPHLYMSSECESVPAATLRLFLNR